MNKKIENLVKNLTKIVKKLNTKNLSYSLSEPNFNNNDKISIKKCIDSTYVSTGSGFTNEFEKKLCGVTKSKYVIATNSGTSALEISLDSLGIKKNDEVLIPDLNYIASANSIIRMGAIPHLVDIELKNIGIDTFKLNKYLTKETVIKNNRCINKKTHRVIKAIIPTHIFGNACDIIKILALAKKFKLIVIEDASEALGSFFKNKHLGNFGKTGVLSFNGNKIITTGAGGAILTNSKKTYSKALKLSKISRIQKNSWEYDYSSLGYNYRLPGLNAALGLSQLKIFNNNLAKKKKLYGYYEKNITKDMGLDLLKFNKNSKWNYWLINIYVKNLNIKSRNIIIKELNKKNIQARPVWKLMHKISYLKKYPKMKMVNSKIAERAIISLPSGPKLIK